MILDGEFDRHHQWKTSLDANAGRNRIAYGEIGSPSDFQRAGF